MMGRKAARNMYFRNTNKTGIQCICWFYSQGKMLYTEELHLSGLTGSASHLDMQKSRIIGFFFKQATLAVEMDKNVYKRIF
jgi:hypothetical protein